MGLYEIIWDYLDNSFVLTAKQTDQLTQVQLYVSRPSLAQTKTTVY